MAIPSAEMAPLAKVVGWLGSGTDAWLALDDAAMALFGQQQFSLPGDSQAIFDAAMHEENFLIALQEQTYVNPIHLFGAGCDHRAKSISGFLCFPEHKINLVEIESHVKLTIKIRMTKSPAVAEIRMTKFEASNQ